ncbi:unnamed protein product [Tetraodon nigroviridis]|uniref:(spotted green pufferfish) hypothetical protein n=1 Tax=Tetraodon nigroviridis TaxID=99883 RepID=Q4SCZ9_TETNG|nr:unnamed protein product [Tetraodon nigroviridis]
MQLRPATGGRRREAWLDAAERKGRSSAGRKVATRRASPADQSLTSPIRDAFAKLLPLSELACGALPRRAGLPSGTQSSPVRVVVRSAVKCNSSHCGIKTESTRKRRRSETRTPAEETGAASGRRGKRSGRRRRGRRARTLPLRSAPNRRGGRQELRRHTGTCPATNEIEVDHHFHCHPLSCGP